MKQWRMAPLIVALVVSAGAAGCGDDSGDEEGAGLGGAAAAGGSGPGSDGGAQGDDTGITVPEDLVAIDTDPAEVTALDNTFDATGIRVPAGTTVRWTNSGRQDHDVIPVEGDWGVEVEGFHPGDTYEHTFTEPGTYNYYCTIHGTAALGMVGVVVVE